MEFAAALEDKANSHAKRIIEIEASADGQTILSEGTVFSASAVTIRGANKELKEMRATMKQLTASITDQAATLTSLSTKTKSGGGSSGQNTNNNKSRPGLHVCADCKMEVYHKEVNCLELEAD